MKKTTFILILFLTFGVKGQEIILQEFASGFGSPVEIVNAKDSRLFVVQQNGFIKIVQPNGVSNSADFLDISSKITFGGERGLLGLAFHPNYSTNGYFFVYYNNTEGNITVSRFSVNPTDPDLADPASEKILLNITKPFTNHNGGSMHFAPDGNLWISTGDGGGGGDPNNNAQNKNSLLGKMLRIDVNSVGTYNIPTDNPFVGTDGADEIWAIGLRNAWKFSFDETTGNVMIADVGQEIFEEINRMPVSQSGINYGWRCYEGNSVYNNSGCAISSTMTFPMAVYDHSGGKCSITGGYVYRGTLYPALVGKYFFADFCSKQIGMMNDDGSIIWSSVFAGNNFSTFGVDANKELYVAAINNGKIFKVTTTPLATENSNISQIKIFPNPTSDKIFVRGLKSGNYAAEIIDYEGKTVLNKMVNKEKIDVSDLKPGVYFLTIKTGQLKIYSQKIIIK
ncbi:PQQ-dependent sugar dehydrogenase [Chryseobacterium suipulveris]|uniref:PQQ-dependent sugar dehydrogenase n=1 Tax=Chryseobacterium suipulveris TaxID=2929800 RepID=A0ABY4BSX3_9FLAO|nr:PQQ-dependent sugar dehydrogenase [Chryseobacterium suipulveris]UOE41879.1 PQQ-dependent sugar dehydrogenase [Chryseobacterium suipulveris]